MLPADNHATSRRDWILANPWPWSILGLVIGLANWLTALVQGESLNGLGVSFLFIGLFSAAAAVALRLNSSAPAYVDGLAPRFRLAILLGLAILFALSAVGVTTLMILRFVDVNPVQLRLNGAILIWFVVGPLSMAAAGYCLKRARPGCTVTPREESAAILLMAAATTFCACRALYNPDSKYDWDSMRLFLAVLFLVAFGSAPLVLVSQTMRRLVVSVLILLHFTGIATAVMSVPPGSPWIAQQTWSRVFQPYLEFMYLNNAYHFYAPEPGPASSLWFRMFYEDSSGKMWAHWLKVPDVDENGAHNYTVALEYQRMLALTENTVPSEPTPVPYVVSKLDGSLVYADWYARRIEHSANKIVGNIGQPDITADGLIVPFHPHIPIPQQFLQPNAASLALIKSCARHVALQPHPTHADWKIKTIKIYRVVHAFPEPGPFIDERMDPRDPANYRPFYLGAYGPTGELLDATEYDAKGKMIKEGDPFLFWLLPMLRDPPTNMLKSPVKSWVAKHAGDPDWIYQFDEKKGRHVIATNDN